MFPIKAPQHHRYAVKYNCTWNSRTVIVTVPWNSSHSFATIKRKELLTGFPNLLHQFSTVQPTCHFKPETGFTALSYNQNSTMHRRKTFLNKFRGKKLHRSPQEPSGAQQQPPRRQEQGLLGPRPLYTERCWVKVVTATKTLLQPYRQIRDLSHVYYIMLCLSAKENKPLVYIKPLFCWNSKESALHMPFKNDVIETQWVPLWTNRWNSWDHTHNKWRITLCYGLIWREGWADQRVRQQKKEPLQNATLLESWQRAGIQHRRPSLPERLRLHLKTQLSWLNTQILQKAITCLTATALGRSGWPRQQATWTTKFFSTGVRNKWSG